MRTAKPITETLLALLILFLMIALASAFVTPAHADAWDNTSIGVGPQYTWFSQDGAAVLSETELGASGALSLRPLISAVGSINYGTADNYWRTDIGLSFTTYDQVDANSQWSVGAGVKRQFYSKHEFGTDEWVANGAVGLATKVWGHVVAFGLLGAYGIDAEDFRTTASLTFPFKTAK